MSSRHKIESWIILNPKEGESEGKKEQIAGQQQHGRPKTNHVNNYMTWKLSKHCRHCQIGFFKKQHTALKLPIRNSD